MGSHVLNGGPHEPHFVCGSMLQEPSDTVHVLPAMPQRAPCNRASLCVPNKPRTDWKSPRLSLLSPKPTWNTLLMQNHTLWSIPVVSNHALFFHQIGVYLQPNWKIITSHLCSLIRDSRSLLNVIFLVAEQYFTERNTQQSVIMKPVSYGCWD